MPRTLSPPSCWLTPTSKYTWTIRLRRPAIWCQGIAPWPRGSGAGRRGGHREWVGWLMITARTCDLAVAQLSVILSGQRPARRLYRGSGRRLGDFPSGTALATSPGSAASGWWGPAFRVEGRWRENHCGGTG